MSDITEFMDDFEQRMLAKIAIMASRWKQDPVGSVKQIPEDFSAAGRNVAAYTAGLPGDLQPIAETFNPTLRGRERLPTSEELIARWGDKDHWSDIPSMLVAPGPGEFKAGFLTAKAGLKAMLGLAKESSVGVALATSLLAREGSGPVVGKEGRLLAPASLTDKTTTHAAGEYDSEINRIFLKRDEWKKLSSDEKLRLLRHEEGHSVVEMLDKQQQKQFIDIASRNKQAIADWSHIQEGRVMRPDDSKYAYEGQLEEMFSDYWRDRRNGADLDQWRKLGIEEDFANLVEPVKTKLEKVIELVDKY